MEVEIVANGKERTFLAKIRWRQNTGHGMAFSHLLKYLDKKPNLYLCRLLKKSVQSRSTLRLAENLEPLLNSAQLIFEVLVQSSSRHLFQRGLILINVRYPLLCSLVHDIISTIGALGLLRLIIVDLGRRSYTPRRQG